MFYVTGDTHGNFFRIKEFCERFETTKEDVLIILGDAGINYYKGGKDIQLKEFISTLPIRLLCIHGNHEIRPQTLPGYQKGVFLGGSVFYEQEYPNIYFAEDGEIFDLNGKKAMVIGGAYSVDKHYRLSKGFGWWEDEQPSEDAKAKAERKLEELGWEIDIMLTHTCPVAYEPREVFLSFIDQSTVDKSTEMWLGYIENKLKRYEKWYCGHYHTAKKVFKVEFLFDGYDVIE